RLVGLVVAFGARLEILIGVPRRAHAAFERIVDVVFRLRVVVHLRAGAGALGRTRRAERQVQVPGVAVARARLGGAIAAREDVTAARALEHRPRLVQPRVGDPILRAATRTLNGHDPPLHPRAGAATVDLEIGRA